MLRIKICGLTTPQDALSAIELGADALGFNFFPGSKRYLEPEPAGKWIATLPKKVTRIAEMPGIDSLQLHGAEAPEFCHRLRGVGIRFEKALPVSDAQSVAKV